MRRVLGLFVTALFLAGLVGYSPSAAAAAQRAHKVNHRVVTHANAPEYSINWSGYAVPAGEGQTITEVTGAWHVPVIKHAPPGLSSSWIGIGGYNTGDLIQVGTASSGNIEGNYAWFEMLPDYETPITEGCAGDNACTVRQGDTMVARVSLVGANVWNIFLTNFGKGSSPKWSWSKTVTYNSSLSSAEWIFEAPQIGIVGLSEFIGGIQTMPAHAPHAHFLAGGSYKLNGEMRSLGHGASKLIMVEQGTGFTSYVLGAPGVAYRTATPSGVAPDGHFQVCAYKRSCPNF